jgi:arsenate reductase (glutaredoxin)
MALQVYGLKKCSTCQKAEAWLKDHKIAYKFTDVREDGISAEQVKGWMKALGGYEKLINRAGYTWRGLPEAEREGLTDAKAVKLVLANPSLIRRPLIESKAGVSVGFSAKVQESLK